MAYEFGFKVTHSRKFGGKTYWAKMYTVTKEEADDMAKYFRKQGGLCRVVKQKCVGGKPTQQRRPPHEGKKVYYLYRRAG